MSENSGKTILAIGAHPDDIEFGCGGILCGESKRGSRIHILVCSRGEAGTSGSPEQREAEARSAAAQLDASIQFLELGGDGKLAATPENAAVVAGVIREIRPDIVLAPTIEENQHPDHGAVGRLARDATRLARYGGLDTLRSFPAHAIANLCFYAITPGGELGKAGRVVVDVSAFVDDWRQLMGRHASQLKTRRYLELQLARARALGLEIGAEYAQPLWPNEDLVVRSLTELPGGNRHF